MKLRSLLCLSAASLGMGLLTQAAHADTLTIASVTASTSGGTVAVYGTFTNTGTTYEYLNSDDFSFSNPGIALGTDYYFDDGPFGLAAGASFTEELFSLVLNSGLTAGSYTNYFDIVGGSTGNSLNVLAYTNYDVVVSNASTAVTPEPSTWLLLGTGVLGLGVVLRRRQGMLASDLA